MKARFWSAVSGLSIGENSRGYAKPGLPADTLGTGSGLCVIVDICVFRPALIHHHRTATTGAQAMPPLRNPLLLRVFIRDCNIQLLWGVIADMPTRCMCIGGQSDRRG